MKYRFKVKIVLDDEKILEAGEYTPESIRKAVCENFEMFDLPQLKTTDGSMMFGDRGRNTDFGALLGVANTLYDSDWFRPYAKKLYWYNLESGAVEDVLKEFAEYDAQYKDV